MTDVYALLAEGPNDTLAMFGNDPWWIILIKAVVAFAGLVVLTLLMIWFERKAVAWMQVRPGPNRHGPFGILQSLADGLKLAFKEDLIPAGADKIVFIVAPIISTACAITAFSIIPMGPEVNIFGVTTPLQLTDLEVGVLLILACSALGVYGIVLGGWSSGSTYSLLGSLRAAAQVISYEIAMGLSIVAVFLTSGTLSTSGIVAAQQEGQKLSFGSVEFEIPGWYALLLLPSFIIFCISVVGETNRAPFDLPEAESELVGGFHTEYSSLKFALFFLAEYINMVTVSAMATTLFLGGWQAPFPAESWWPAANEGWWPLLWFFGKVAVLLFGFVWLRGTLPRFRYDQFMRLGWKVLVPVNLVWIVALAGFYAGRASESLSTRISVIGGVGLLVLLALMFWPSRPEYKPSSEPDIGVGGYPTPPIDLEVPPSPNAKQIEAKREPVSTNEGGQ